MTTYGGVAKSRTRLSDLTFTFMVGSQAALVVKNLSASARAAGDIEGSIPGSGRSPGEGNGNLLQYSCLENPKDRGAWPALGHGITENQTGPERLSNSLVGSA